MMYIVIKTFCLEHSDTVGCKTKMKYWLEIFYLVADDIYNGVEYDFMMMTIRSQYLIVYSIFVTKWWNLYIYIYIHRLQYLILYNFWVFLLKKICKVTECCRNIANAAKRTLLWFVISKIESHASS